MQKKNSIKYVLYALIYSVIIFMTFYTIFYHNNINKIAGNVNKMRIESIFICILLFSLYFIFQGIYMKRNLKLLDEDIKLSKGIFYSVVEFFFSGITPSSTGGQPVQIYYMNKDGIPNKKSLICLIINTMYFKLILVTFTLLILIFKYNYIFSISPLFTFFFILGIVVDTMVAIFGYLSLYKQIIAKSILSTINRVAKKIRINYQIDVDKKIEDFSKEVEHISKNKKELIFELFITAIQRLCLFSISYVIYRSFGLNDFNYLELLVIQISVQMAIEFVPIPGGTGVSEYLFSLFFITVFGTALAPTAMIVTRTFAFYIPLILCGIIILVKFIIDKWKIYKKMV